MGLSRAVPTSGPAKQRGPYTKGVARRREIVDTALEVLADRGLGNASLDEISSRVGITRQGLLHYFGTRENLILAVLEERDARDMAAGMAGYRPGEPPEEAYERVLARTREYPGLARLYTAFAAAATDPSHPAHQFFRDRYRRIRDQIASSSTRPSPPASWTRASTRPPPANGSSASSTDSSSSGCSTLSSTPAPPSATRCATCSRRP